MKTFYPRKIFHVLLWCCIPFGLIMGPINFCLAEEEAPRKSLLYLYSYQSSHATFSKMMQGIANVLEPAGIPFDIECLDLKRHDTPEHRQHLLGPGRGPGLYL